MIYQFNCGKVPEVNIVGGKGKALLETTGAGLPVPNGFILSVNFFKPWIKILKNTIEWKEMLKNVTVENCTRVQDLIKNLKPNKVQLDAFNDAMKQVKGDVFAVRSSSPEEDLEDTSFAGMYETLLGIKRDDVLNSSREIFKSCFDFRVMEYKSFHNLNLENTSIAVVIQTQIFSEISGVGFSINPINNAYDETFINASFGLGEMVVSGLITPDTYIIDVVKRKIIHKEIGDKKTKFRVSPNGGIEEIAVKNKKEQALTDKQINEVSSLIKMCERFYNKPIDIEWAYNKGILYLLQARPITTYFPIFDELMTKPGEEKLLYIDILTITQGFNDSLSVLGTDIWGEIVRESGGRVLNCTGNGTAPVINGRQYFNIFYLYKALGKAIGNGYMFGHDASAKKMMNNIDLSQYELTHYPDTIKGAKWNMLKMGLKFAPPAINAVFMNYESQISKYMNIYKTALSHTKDYTPKTKFDQTISLAIKDIGTVVSASGLLMAGLSASSKLKKMFKNTDVEVELAALGMELRGNPTSEMGHMQFKIASSKEFIKTKSAEEFVVNIENNTYSKEFMKLYHDFIERHGARTFKEIDIASPRASDDLHKLYHRLKEINIYDSQIQKVKAKKEKAYNSLLKIANENGFGKKYKKQVEIYQSTFGYREYIKYSTVNFIANLRRIALLIAKDFVKATRLDNVNQIFDLHITDIVEAQNNNSIDLRARIEENLIPYRKTKNVKDWPIMFDSRGKIYRPVLEVKDGDYVGMSISPGKYIGKAKVLASPYEKTLEAGEILVTKSTEPSWTPIFINASAVVMEVGGPLQHGGIIAREYGIPCVSGLSGIVDIIKDGDMLEVDGTSGVVRIL
ncbi:PEP/pyruvate-binding domain-containing protein [Clostridium oceanicum]|uniref:PEP/pyruvate-binding domain-containing protein n=1 Tax=Clostridium oceanicum TaxID=1543 RepID=A0ABN1JK23_9CLOT